MRRPDILQLLLALVPIYNIWVCPSANYNQSWHTGAGAEVRTKIEEHWVGSKTLRRPERHTKTVRKQPESLKTLRTCLGQRKTGSSKRGSYFRVGTRSIVEARPSSAPLRRVGSSLPAATGPIKPGPWLCRLLEGVFPLCSSTTICWTTC